MSIVMTSRYPADPFSSVMFDNFSSLGLDNHRENLQLTHPSPDELGNNSGGDSPGASTTYPSPGSTISSGSSPQPKSGDGRLLISSSSELALALSPASAAEAAVNQACFFTHALFVL